MSYTIEIQPAGVHFQSENNLLDDALAQSLPLDHSCKTGDCGACSAQVLSGQVQNEKGQTVTQGSVLTCQSKALSDVVLKANYYPELTHIKTQTVPCKVAKVQYLTDDILSLTFRLPPTAQFEYLAGQYVDLSFQGVKRSYSIANACSALKQIELHIRKVPDGAMSGLLFGSVAENQLMRMEGPKGTFFVRDGDKPLVFIATGTGIAPVKAMVEQLISTDDQREVHIYWGMQYQSEIYCQELMSYSQQYANIHFTSVLSQESHPQSECGYVQDIVIKNVAGLEFFEVYACGSVKMIEAAKALFIEHGLPSEAFLSDAFTPAK
ncbi:FAD-binding oxidoreductase [Vibrio sp. Vb2133]|uniref:FAD-binding oxidoreductase n=1 Tax=Vibrio TaxID=662 RepID=UPI000C9C43C7|nr:MULTISPECIES: FAD-binding oxidoreductase [Vibrio]MCG9612081.1 FAD-binding oxidoreductase [Vibrio harveyi]MCG9670191.1 FAD-binding oxidoreductase [Vibrio harveyi]MCX8824517.1 FAD-binding oxidoreductase [Vibrio parahaemolyticus]MCX8835052.1 FAD-binding oxidoreductase [Vibrio parahaemolyticus]MCX8931110.1 FAD-binding oxidoreductase [Vibrio parahaemolyticus]